MNFTFDGVSSDQFGIVVTEAEAPLLPPVRRREAEVPGRPGAYDFPAELGPRLITFACKIRGASMGALLSQARTIASWLNPHKGVKQLILGEESDKYYNARVAEWVAPRYKVTRSEFSVTFICADPFAYLVAEDEASTGSTPFNVTNQGTMVSVPRYRLSGESAGDPDKLKIKMGTADWIVFDGVLEQGQKLQLDISRLTVTVVDASNVFVRNALADISGADLTTLKLVPGENTLEVATEGNATWSSMDIIPRSRWY